MTLHDLEWPFYVKFSLLRTALLRTYLLYTVFTHVTGELVYNLFISCDHRRCTDLWLHIRNLKANIIVFSIS